MDNIIFEKKINQYIDYINNRLSEILSIEYPEKIYEAMRYSVFAGGKRLRPILTLMSCEMLGGSKEEAVVPD